LNATKLAIDAIGWSGAIVLLLAYGAISFRRIEASTWLYQGANAAGSICLVLNTLYYHAYPSAFVNLIWIAIALTAGMRIKNNPNDA
jgi:hypothetical protein